MAHLLLRHRDIPGIDRLEVYREHGGFEAFEKAVTTMQPGEITDIVKNSGLRGRGRRGLPHRDEMVVHRQEYLAPLRGGQR